MQAFKSGVGDKANYPERGVTLVEILIVLAVLSVLLVVAFPSYDNVLAESEVDKARYNLATGLALARTEAIKRAENVSFCHGTTNAACGNATDPSDWTSLGWKVSVVSDSEVIRVDESPNSNVTIQYSCGDSVTYTPLGTLSTNGNECELSFTDARGVGVSKYLCIAATGRVRMSDVALCP